MSSETDIDAAISLRNVTKRFKKRTVRQEYTTLKSELMNALLRRKRADKAQGHFIEALRGVDLTIPRGKTVGIIGRNGSGKSTLLKLLTGIYSPSTGDLQVKGRISALLELGAGFHPDFSGRENILINGIILGMSRADLKDRMDEIIAFSELGEFIDEPVRTYSSGMYMRLAFAVATHVDPDILIIDEILAVGDEHFGKKSMARMSQFKREGKTIVLVTHDLGTVERWCDMAAWIDGGRIREAGNPAAVVAHYREAVRLAEESDRPFTPPALSADGGALPEIAGNARTDDGLRVEGIRVLNAKGEPAQSIDAELGCTVEIELSAQGRDATSAVQLQISRDDGTLVFRTNTEYEGFNLPTPLPARFTLSVSLDRVGLIGGQYQVNAAIVRAGTPLAGSKQAPLHVWCKLGSEGIYRPKHEWRLPATSDSASSPTRPAVASAS